MASARTAPGEPARPEKRTPFAAPARPGPGGEGPTAVPRPGLRERKKIRTRRDIRTAAFRLFTEHGYEATSVDRIAEEAEVSPSTVFRYFPTKEDMVLLDDYDELLAGALLARPAAEPPVTALRHALLDVVAQALREDHEEAELRIRLAVEVPAVRARMTESTCVAGATLAHALAERTGRTPDDLTLRVLTGAVTGALTQAMFHWAAHPEQAPLLTTLERALTTLEAALPGLGTPSARHGGR
ncbi:TetR family transcriptional regulator [Streptomyces sp. HNM0574]|uniref:TetR/AcrR family transcriptional regulator n=1 Tax=Streptomyces sp. HNM0574 TaxID=2714954 RepID=UPI00146D3ADD|nr:TetR family transcriptional regulator [Streptomyces sp. HNM0574]NLU66673.1 TetR family transcriptional regulator [Streptomyces sp. HNM0574]